METYKSVGFNLITFATGLEPYGQYVFILGACTEAGCSNSTETTVRTMQDRPQGAWLSCRTFSHLWRTAEYVYLPVFLPQNLDNIQI